MNGWNLIREMDSLWRDIDEIFRGSGVGLTSETPAWAGSSYPRLAVREAEDKVIVEALIPGIDPKSLDISVLRNALSLAGERIFDQAESGTWHRRERPSGRFMRTLDLPAEIDADKVSADYRQGVLHITLPKAESAKPKRIEVSA